jgi:hypothetical protein
MPMITPTVLHKYFLFYYVVGLTEINVNGSSMLYNIPLDIFFINEINGTNGVIVDFSRAFTFLNIASYITISQVIKVHSRLMLSEC